LLSRVRFDEILRLSIVIVLAVHHLPAAIIALVPCLPIEDAVAEQT
jgi:hypothetical protein